MFPVRFSFFKFLYPLSIEVLCDEMLSCESANRKFSMRLGQKVKDIFHNILNE